MKRFMVLIAVLLLTLASTSSVGAAGKETVTDTFHGTSIIPATGQGLPAEVDWNHPIPGPGGTIGFNYVYKAEGLASGELPGRFTYVENGIVYLDGAFNVAGNVYVSGEIDLTPNRPGPAVKLVDTNSEAYQYGVASGTVSDLSRGARGVLGRIVDPKNVNPQIGVPFKPQGGQLIYGYFTFNYGGKTFTGYSTPDFAEFAITITFDNPSE